MKQLFAMVAVAIFSLAVVSCDTKKDEPTYTLSADKTVVVPGDVIVFTLTGENVDGKNWGMCDYGSCFPVKFVNNKYSYTVRADAQVGTFGFYAQSLPDQKIITEKVKITINAAPAAQ